MHKKFTDSQVKELVSRYLNKEIKRKFVQEILGIGKTRFFELVKSYSENKDSFSVGYVRKNSTRSIPKEVENNIMAELKAEQGLIDDKKMPIRSYNYSYIRDRLLNDYSQKVALSTIIDRAKRNGFYLGKQSKEKHHDREVLTNYVGELVQHDSSHHKWSPYCSSMWYLITTIDDYSRYMLYAKLVERETTWTHIEAIESVILKYGLPYSYYVDSHSIFRFVQGRDSLYRNHYLLTDDVQTQWKRVLDDLGVNVIYALSPQAKGKAERPYGWLQDRIVRTCAREGIADIEDAEKVLSKEMERYNYKQVHSTTGEIPYIRFKRALSDKVSLFREFDLLPPYKSTKDIFCIKMTRIIDAYRQISINNLKLKLNGAPRETAEINICPIDKEITELRIWCNKQLIDVIKVKPCDLNMVHF